MYKISKNILFVKGSAKALLYNFNNTSLYSVGLNWITEVLCIIKNAEENKEIIEYLRQEQLIVKKNAHEKRLINKGVAPSITHAWIEITNRCNLKCIHCYESEKNTNSMDFFTFKKLIDTLQKYQIKSIQLTGGEPLLHPEIARFIDYCCGKFNYMEIYTNATLLTRTFIEDICNKNDVTIAISELADDVDEYNYITSSQGMYNAYTANKKLLIENAKHYRIGKICIHKKIFDENCDFPRLVGNATISLYTPEMLAKKIITQETFSKHFSPDIVINNLYYNRCFSKSIYIDAQYNVYPCPMERRIQHGNILKNNMELLIDDDIVTLTKDKVSECKHCEYRYACNDCRPDTQSNDVLKKPWYCMYNPFRGEWQNTDEYIKKTLSI